MKKAGTPVQVGAPDPERRTSPILDHDSDTEEAFDGNLEVETGVCYFNDQAFAIGEYVCSGNELLHCEQRGIWVPKGPCRPV